MIHFCVLSAELKMKLTYISFTGVKELPFCGDIFLSTGLDLPNILSQSAIFEFLDDALKHKVFLNDILLIFKITYIKLEKKKHVNFNILENYFTQIRDLEANLKNNDKYDKKWIVIVTCYNVSQEIK